MVTVLWWRVRERTTEREGEGAGEEGNVSESERKRDACPTKQDWGRSTGNEGMDWRHSIQVVSWVI